MSEDPDKKLSPKNAVEAVKAGEQKINVERGIFSNSEYQQLINVIKEHGSSCVVEMNLNSCMIDDFRVEMLCKALDSDCVLEKLSLCRNKITNVGGEMLIEIINRCSHLYVIEFENNITLSVEMCFRLKEEMKRKHGRLQEEKRKCLLVPMSISERNGKIDRDWNVVDDDDVFVNKKREESKNEKLLSNGGDDEEKYSQGHSTNSTSEQHTPFVFHISPSSYTYKVTEGNNQREELSVPQSRVCKIDSFLSHEECAHFLQQINDSVRFSSLSKEFASFRNNERCVVYSEDLSSLLWERLKLFVKKEDMENVRPFGFDQQGVWKPTRLGAWWKISKYEPLTFVKPHMDSSYVVSARERSIYTLMIFLNEDCEGGCTAFFPRDINLKTPSHTNTNNIQNSNSGNSGNGHTPLHQIRPQTGRALFFNHDTVHAGEEVKAGYKYVMRTELLFECVSNAGSLDMGMHSVEFHRVRAFFDESERLAKMGRMVESSQVYLSAMEAQSDYGSFFRNPRAQHAVSALSATVVATIANSTAISTTFSSSSSSSASCSSSSFSTPTITMSSISSTPTSCTTTTMSSFSLSQIAEANKKKWILRQQETFLVFSYVKLTDILRFSEVCFFFAQVARESGLWYKLYIQTWPAYVCDIERQLIAPHNQIQSSSGSSSSSSSDIKKSLSETQQPNMLYKDWLSSYKHTHYITKHFRTIVLDIGQQNFKFGMVGGVGGEGGYPMSFWNVVGNESMGSHPDASIAAGEKAFLYHTGYSQVVESGHIVYNNKISPYHLERALRYMYFRYFKNINYRRSYGNKLYEYAIKASSAHPVLVASPLSFACWGEQEKVIEKVLLDLGVPFVGFCDSAILILAAHGVRTGVVVGMGQQSTVIVVVKDGKRLLTNSELKGADALIGEKEKDPVKYDELFKKKELPTPSASSSVPFYPERVELGVYLKDDKTVFNFLRTQVVRLINQKKIVEDLFSQGLVAKTLEAIQDVCRGSISSNNSSNRNGSSATSSGSSGIDNDLYATLLQRVVLSGGLSQLAGVKMRFVTEMKGLLGTPSSSSSSFKLFATPASSANVATFNGSSSAFTNDPSNATFDRTQDIVFGGLAVAQTSACNSLFTVCRESGGLDASS